MTGALGKFGESVGTWAGAAGGLLSEGVTIVGDGLYDETMVHASALQETMAQRGAEWARAGRGPGDPIADLERRRDRVDWLGQKVDWSNGKARTTLLQGLLDAHYHMDGPNDPQLLDGLQKWQASVEPLARSLTSLLVVADTGTGKSFALGKAACSWAVDMGAKVVIIVEDHSQRENQQKEMSLPSHPLYQATVIDKTLKVVGKPGGPAKRFAVEEGPGIALLTYVEAGNCTIRDAECFENAYIIMDEVHRLVRPESGPWAESVTRLARYFGLKGGVDTRRPKDHVAKQRFLMGLTATPAHSLGTDEGLREFVALISLFHDAPPSVGDMKVVEKGEAATTKAETPSAKGGKVAKAGTKVGTPPAGGGEATKTRGRRSKTKETDDDLRVKCDVPAPREFADPPSEALMGANVLYYSAERNTAEYPRYEPDADVVLVPVVQADPKVDGFSAMRRGNKTNKITDNMNSYWRRLDSIATASVGPVYRTLEKYPNRKTLVFVETARMARTLRKALAEDPRHSAYEFRTLLNEPQGHQAEWHQKIEFGHSVAKNLVLITHMRKGYATGHTFDGKAASVLTFLKLIEDESHADVDLLDSTFEYVRLLNPSMSREKTERALRKLRTALGLDDSASSADLRRAYDSGEDAFAQAAIELFGALEVVTADERLLGTNRYQERVDPSSSRPYVTDMMTTYGDTKRVRSGGPTTYHSTAYDEASVLEKMRKIDKTARPTCEMFVYDSLREEKQLNDALLQELFRISYGYKAFYAARPASFGGDGVIDRLTHASRKAANARRFVGGMYNQWGKETHISRQLLSNDVGDEQEYGLLPDAVDLLGRRGAQLLINTVPSSYLKWKQLLGRARRRWSHAGWDDPVDRRVQQAVLIPCLTSSTAAAKIAKAAENAKAAKTVQPAMTTAEAASTAKAEMDSSFVGQSMKNVGNALDGMSSKMVNRWQLKD